VGHRRLLETGRKLDGDRLAEVIEFSSLGEIRVALEISERIDVSASFGQELGGFRVEACVTSRRLIPLGEGQVGDPGTERNQHDEPENQPETPRAGLNRFGT